MSPWRGLTRAGPDRDWTLARLVAALVSFLPFTEVLAGRALYYRDLSFHFFPFRRFVVEGLLHGEIRRWNPYLNGGAPVALPPVAYPVDLLQALVPNEWGFSLVLALHVPIAALSFLSLGRRLGLGPAPATLAALVYALSGFALSSVNLYVHVQALAWAPLAISLLLAAASGAPRDMALAAIALAVCLSTSGVEIALQAIACAFVLAASLRARDHLRFGASVLLGAGLALAPLAPLLANVASGRRAAGFSTAEAVNQSLHPVSLLQTLVAGLFGDPVASGYSYWGARFTGGPSPYFPSLYLGGAALCLAAIGLARGAHRRRLALLLVLGLLLALGKWAGLDVLVGFAPSLAKFRFPVKAFFTILVAVSLLAGYGAQRLQDEPRAFRVLLAGSAALAAVLLSLSLVEPALPGAFAWVEQQLFVASYPAELRAAALRTVARDAAAGAAALLAVAGIAWLALRGRVKPHLATAAVAAVAAADLLRAGTFLNPTVPASFYSYSTETSLVAARLREAGGRVFTCTVFAMPSFREAVRRTPHSAVWTASVWRESLSPQANTDLGVEAAGPDPTALAAAGEALSRDEAACREPGTLARLRAGGVRFVLSVQPFDNPALRLVDAVSPARIAPLSLMVYELENGLPDPTLWTTPDDVDERGLGRALEGGGARYVETAPGSVRVSVESPAEAFLILRRNHATGWSATVNGWPAEIARANGRHQAVRVPAGASDVRLRYAAPLGWPFVGVSLASAALCAVLAWRRRTDASAG